MNKQCNLNSFVQKYYLGQNQGFFYQVIKVADKQKLGIVLSDMIYIQKGFYQ